MGSAQIHAGIAVSHTDVLTAVGKGNGAVLVDGNGPDFGITVAGHNAVSNGDVHADVIVSGLGGRQRLVVSGSIDNDLIAGSEGQRRLHRIGGFFGRLRGFRGSRLLTALFQLIQGEIAGIAVGTAGNSCGLVATELICGCNIACQNNSIAALTPELERSVGAGHRPVVVGSADAVVVAALGCNSNAIAVGQLNIGAVNGQGPYQICGRIRHCAVCCCNGFR